jgi:diaminopimelate decarboxylase
VGPQLAAFLTDRLLLRSLVDALGSPLNVLLPGTVAGFCAVYRRHRLTGRVYFAHKTNPSSALVRTAEDPAAVGLDVASRLRTRPTVEGGA